MSADDNFERAVRVTLDSFAAGIIRGLDDPALKKDIARQISDFFLAHLRSGVCVTIAQVEALYPELANFLHDVKPYEDAAAPDQPRKE